MEASFLGQFLLQEKVVTPKQLGLALERQRRSNRRLGELAVERGIISAEDAGRVCESQRFRDLPFGELAVEMGLMRREDLDAMLFLHTVHTTRLGEVLLEMGFIDKPGFSSLMAAYFSRRQGNRVGMAYLLDGSLPAALLASLAGAVERACLRVNGLAMAVVEVGADLDPAAYAAAYRFPVCPAGDRDACCAVLAVGLDPLAGEGLMAVAGRYFHESLAQRGVSLACCNLGAQPVRPGDLPRPAMAVRLAPPDSALELAVACGLGER